MPPGGSQALATGGWMSRMCLMAQLLARQGGFQDSGDRVRGIGKQDASMDQDSKGLRPPLPDTFQNIV